jgi:stearoyl-CoA desaturase (delta-9 desaturase)
MKISHNQKVRTLQLINHILAPVGIFYSIYTKNYEYLFLSIVLFYFIGIVGINICYHRLLSHRSFETYNIIEKIMSLVGVLATMGSPIAWVSVHRQHHLYTDTTKDPHSPKIKGALKIWFGFWGNVVIESRFVKDMLKDKFQKYLHQNYLKIILIYCLLLVFINPWLIIFCYCVPAFLIFHVSNGTTVISHIYGYKTYKTNDNSKNSWIGSLMTMGEGWHNNHHAQPLNWKSGEKWWEIDPTAWVIKLIKK